MAIRGVIVATPGTSDQEIVPWWSFTKSVLAAAALVLVDQRRLNLDEPVEGKPCTLRHLLQHTSGLPDYGNLAEYHAAVAAGNEPWQKEELLRRVKSTELLFVPGTSWAYSNIGYLFVKEIIESTTGQGLDRALRELVFEPLGAQGAYVATAIEHLDGTVWGNERRYHPGWVYHGLVVGPAPAAALILEGLLYGPLLSDSLRVQMLSTVSLGRRFPGRPAVHPTYGLGLMIDSQSSLGRMVGHTGQGPGSTAAVYSFPDFRKPITLAAMAPGDSVEALGGLEAHVLALASERQFGAMLN